MAVVLSLRLYQSTFRRSGLGLRPGLSAARLRASLGWCCVSRAFCSDCALCCSRQLETASRQAVVLQSGKPAAVVTGAAHSKIRRKVLYCKLGMSSRSCNAFLCGLPMANALHKCYYGLFARMSDSSLHCISVITVLESNNPLLESSMQAPGKAAGTRGSMGFRHGSVDHFCISAYCVMNVLPASDSASGIGISWDKQR